MKRSVLVVLCCLLLAGCAQYKGKGMSSVNANYKPYDGYATKGYLGTGMTQPAE